MADSMSQKYEPSSDFLKAISADEVPLSGGAFADQNLSRLISMTCDADLANRDWATFLLALSEIDTPSVREALLHATKDLSDSVKAEAIWGLALRDTALALPLVQEALRADSVQMPILEAAELCAHPSLVDDLRVWTEPSDDTFIDECATQALAACQKGTKRTEVKP